MKSLTIKVTAKKHKDFKKETEECEAPG